jgi:hypothetical protein
LTTIKRRISQRTRSLSKVINEAIIQILKAYKMTVNNLLLIQKENYDLQAAHEKKKQKHQQSRKQISHKQGITREKAQALIQSRAEASQTVTATPAKPELPTSQPPIRRQFRCSRCSIAGHKITGYPNHTSN